MSALKFSDAFKYPFNRAVGMLNILWILLPIIGWFPLGGYGIRIVKEFSKGRFKKLPKFSFGSDFSLGFFMFLKAIPLVLVYVIVSSLLEKMSIVGGVVQILIAIFILPMLFINFFNKETIKSSFDLKVVKPVFNNLGDYIMAILKSILLTIIFLIMIIVLVGIPAGQFTKNIFMADFYRRHVR